MKNYLICQLSINMRRKRVVKRIASSAKTWIMMICP